MKKLLLLTILIFLYGDVFSQLKKIRTEKKPAKILTKDLSPRDSIIKAIDAIINSYAGQPNNSNTWNSVNNEINNLLITKWRSGVLMGTTQSQAFYINIGQQTMTQQDITQGKLIVLVGIAMIKPAEFEALRFEKQL